MLEFEDYIQVTKDLENEFNLELELIGESIEDYFNELEKLEEKKKDLKRHAKEVGAIGVAGAVAGAAVGSKVAKKRVARKIDARKLKAASKNLIGTGKKAILSIAHFGDPNTAVKYLKGANFGAKKAAAKAQIRGTKAAKASGIIPKTAAKWALAGAGVAAAAALIAKIYNKQQGLEYEIADDEDEFEVKKKKRLLSKLGEKMKMAKSKLKREKEKARDKYNSMSDEKKDQIDKKAEDLVNSI